MKRNLFRALLCACFTLVLAAPAAADVIWEPEDSFYNAHREEMTYVNRQYQLAGHGGSVTLCDKPEGAARKTLDNGQSVTVQFTWPGEIDWGYVVYFGQDGFEGWVPMDDLSLIYDSQSFAEDHGAEIVTGGPVPVEFTQAVLYAYPGGPSGGVLEEDRDYQSFSQVFTQTYTDGSGLRWGYVGYYMGHRESWVCLDDPMNENLDTGVVEPGASVSQQRGAPAYVPGPSASGTLWIAAALVAAAALGTLFLIKKFTRPAVR